MLSLSLHAAVFGCRELRESATSRSVLSRLLRVSIVEIVVGLSSGIIMSLVLCHDYDYIKCIVGCIEAYTHLAAH